MLHLKRFKGGEEEFSSKSKITDKIIFSEELDLSEYVLNHNLPNDWEEETKLDEKLIYELYAIVNHIGTMGFGHYTAYCKNPEN